MQKDTCSQINTTGSLVSSKVLKTNTSIYTKSPHLMSTLTTSSIDKYGVLSSPYEKEPIPVPPWSDNSDWVPSNASILSNRLSSDTDKLQGCYPHVGVIMSPKNYFGHIKIKRYDFINEEPYARKDKSMKECPVHGFASQEQQERSGNQGEVDARRSEGRNNGNFHLQSPNQDISACAPDDNQLLDMRNISNAVTEEETHSHLPNRFHWPGCSQPSDASFSSSDDMERLMDIMNSHYTSSSLLPLTPKPTLPGIGSFGSPFQYMSNPFFPPIMYPGNFDGPILPPPPFLDMQPKFHPFASSAYNWMQERTRDLAASMFPSVIRPKAIDGTPVFTSFTGPEEQTHSPMPHHLPYPSPAAMFRAANLIPPFYLSRRENTTTRFTAADGETLSISNTSVAAPSTEYTSTSATKTPMNSWNDVSNNQKSTSFYSPPSTGSSQISLIKPDNLFSYTLAADPSDVMRYIPNTSSHNCVDVGPTESDEEDEMYTQADCDDGVIYPFRERFDEVEESKEVKKPIPPSRKSHVCEICGKTYARAFTLKTHQRIHTGEKPYQCKVCKRCFAQGSGLESHMRVHTGEKPYKCPVCCRAFSHSSAVKSHLRTHTGEKPFRCDLCGKYFGDQSTLKKHTRVHTGEKPFKCSICTLTFTQVGNMNKHLKNVHAEDKSV